MTTEGLPYALVMAAPAASSAAEGGGAIQRKLRRLVGVFLSRCLAGLAVASLQFCAIITV